MDKEILNLMRGYKKQIPSDMYVNLLASGIIDSFDMVNIVALLESHFQISIEAEDILPENFKSIDAMTKLMSKYIKED